MSTRDTIIEYHQTTKHHPRRMARSLGYLNWATQPNPFRPFRGAPLTPLRLTGIEYSPSYDTIWQPGPISRITG